MWSGGQAEGSQRFMALLLEKTPHEYAVNSSEVRTTEMVLKHMHDMLG